jgi:ketosteroid isomerase-like protein
VSIYCAAVLAGCAAQREAPATDTATTQATNAAGPARAAQGGSAEQQIPGLLREYLAAYFRGDGAALQRSEADHFVVLSAAGVEPADARRYAAIDSARRANTWFPQPVSFDLEGVTVRQHGDLATAYGRATAAPPGQARAPYVFSSWWARRGDQWEVVQYHFTPARVPRDSGNVAR